MFANVDQVRVAYDAEAVDLHADITVRMGGKRVDTTVGRLLLWEVIPKENIVSLHHIMVSDEDQARTVHAGLKKGGSFSDMVKKHSES